MAFKFTTIASNATYNLSRSVASVDEGSQVTITLATTGVQRGQPIPYTITGGGVTSSDFVGSPSLTGNITIGNNVGAVILTANADVTTEGQETLVFTLNDTQQAVSVAINDTSTASAVTYPQTRVSSTINPNPLGETWGDDFGTAVAVSGNLALVGSQREDIPTATRTGKAYLVNVTTGAIVHQFDNPDDGVAIAAGDMFGSGVALTSTRAIIAAYNDTDNEVATYRGKVCVFDTTTYELLYTLYGTEDLATFGSAVATAGGKLVVGASGAGTNRGRVFVYNLADSTLLATIENPNPVTPDGVLYGDTRGEDFFGASVAISGDVIVVGAPYRWSAGGVYGAGYAYTYSVAALTATGNTPTRTIPNPTGGAAWTTSEGVYAEYFGWSVATNGSKVVIGSYGTYGTNTYASMPGMGRVYIYDATGSVAPTEIASPSSTPLALFATPYGDGFGWSVAASGDYMMVGANTATDSNGNYYAGRVDVFNINSGALLTSFNDPNLAGGTPSYTGFGTAVAMSGNIAVASAPFDADLGIVYSYV